MLSLSDERAADGEIAAEHTALNGLSRANRNAARHSMGDGAGPSLSRPAYDGMR